MGRPRRVWPGYLFLLTLLLGSLFGAVKSQAQEFNPQSDDDIPRDLSPENIIKFTPMGASQFADGRIEAIFSLETKGGFTIYVDKMSIENDSGFELLQKLTPPEIEIEDPLTGKIVRVFDEGEFRLELMPTGGRKTDKLALRIKALGCTSKICLKPHTFKIDFSVFPFASPLGLAAAGDPVLSSPTGPIQMPGRLEKGARVDPGSWESQLARFFTASEASWYLLVLVAILGGLLTNATPCVAPMLPITLRLLGKQGHQPLLAGLSYAAGIMLTYSAMGAVVILSGGLFGQALSNPWVNAGFALIMLFLALGMLGFGSLGFLQKFGHKFELAKPSLGNAFIMGTGAGLVAAPCTGPVLGAVLTYVSTLPEPSFGLYLVAAYAFGFALPYVFLGMLSGQLSKRRVSPRLQMATKLLFASVMFGLVLYFLRVPGYRFFTLFYGQFGGVAAAGIAGGLALVFLLSYRPGVFATKKLSVLTCLTLGIGLFSAWQASSQVAAVRVENGDDTAANQLEYNHNLEQSLLESHLTGKPVFLDNWAEWCEACKKMDVTTFLDAALIAELRSNWILVKLDLTLMEENEEAHLAAYGIQGLPTMTLIDASGTEARYTNIVGYQSASELLPALLLFREKAQ